MRAFDRKHWAILAWLVAMLLAVAACDCGDDDDDDNGVGDDDDDDNDTTPDDDDDTADDDTVDDDDDDTTDDDTGDDDTGDDDDDDDTTPSCDWDTHDPLIVAGKELLGEMEPEAAYDSFMDALEVCPESADARLGVVLADAQWYMAWLHRWVDYLSGWNPAPHDDKSVGTTIQAIAQLQLLPMNAEMFRMIDELTADHPDVRFFLADYPWWIDGDHVVLDLSGEWDAADLENLRAFTRFWEAFSRFIISYDLTFDWSLFALNPAPSGDIMEIIHFYAGLILELIADENYPDFLNFLDGGEEEIAAAATNAGFACLDTIAAFAAVRAETDPQQDDVVGYVDENGNGQYDAGENYVLPYYGPLSDELQLSWESVLVMAQNLGAAFLDGGPDDLHPVVPEWFLLSDLNWLIEFLDQAFAYYGYPEVRFPPIPVPIGTFFYNPPDDGLRSTMQTIAQLIYDLTAPDQTEVPR